MRLAASTAIKLQAAVCAGGVVVCLRLGAAGRCAHAAAQAVPPGATDTGVGGDHRADADTGAGLVALAYELLDAHSDTSQLADGLAYDRAWAAHLDYLRALQRKGREMLARTTPDELSFCHSTDLGGLDVR
jgi:hypothetical protein